jgi:hypothetical protein
MILRLVLKLEISFYRVIISWRILVLVRYLHGEIFEFPSIFFCLESLFNVNGKATMWLTPCLMKFFLPGFHHFTMDFHQFPKSWKQRNQRLILFQHLGLDNIGEGPQVWKVTPKVSIRAPYQPIVVCVGLIQIASIIYYIGCLRFHQRTITKEVTKEQSQGY